MRTQRVPSRPLYQRRAAWRRPPRNARDRADTTPRRGAWRPGGAQPPLRSLAAQTCGCARQRALSFVCASQQTTSRVPERQVRRARQRCCGQLLRLTQVDNARTRDCWHRHRLLQLRCACWMSAARVQLSDLRLITHLRGGDEGCRGVGEGAAQRGRRARCGERCARQLRVRGAQHRNVGGYGNGRRRRRSC